ncbi:protein NEDD1 [Agrilus planipennis]|uniref:Protein NEDD1 n=1 Tax=Agrilus planipennis TaxID=224129 RepID=A0A1W4XMI8_AGRPL|nr:protein NEDD1 [Agrilus planipennis]
MSLIATSSTDIKFHLWLEGNLKYSYLPVSHSSGFIKTLSWAKDGTWLVLIPTSGYAEIVSVKDSVKLLLKIKDIHQPTCAIFPKTTKKYIALGTYSGQVLIYDIKNKSIRKRFPRASSWIQNVDCNANDTHLAAATSAGDILIYNMTASNLIATYKIPNCSSASTICFHRTKRNLLAAGSEEGIVAVWDINTNERKASFQAHYAPVTDVALSPIRSDLVATVGKDRQFMFYDVHNKKNVLQMEVPSSMLALDFSHCGLYLGMGSQNGHVVIYDMRNLAKPVSAFPTHEGKKITRVSFQRALNVTEEESSTTIIDDNFVTNESINDKQNSYTTSPYHFNDQSNTNDQEHAKDIGDSFLVSLENSNSYSIVTTPQHEINFSFPKGTSAVTLESSEKKNQQFLGDVNKKTPASCNKKAASTPKYLQAEVPIGVNSPIISPVCPPVNLTDIKKVFTEIVHEELNTLKADLRHEFMESMAQTRRQFLDLQMFLVKEFINVENTVYKVSGVTVEEYAGDSQVLRENIRLKQEIELLKEKVVEKDNPPDFS